jgi:hypothetical protein
MLADSAECTARLSPDGPPVEAPRLGRRTGGGRDDCEGDNASAGAFGSVFGLALGARSGSHRG